MAVDVHAVLRNLLEFYDFRGTTVLSVGAGGGQLAEYGRTAKRVVAVDHDPDALRALAERLAERGLADRFELLAADVLAVERRADVVLFEFSLHEMSDPAAALGHAAALAPDVVVLDHAEGSTWAWHVVEEDKLAVAARAIAARGTRRSLRVETVQRFATYAELTDKVGVQGGEALRRAEPFAGRSGFEIPMAYRLDLI
ncbi:MAG: class I SAM-dependent methyltransferase [Acidobacteriota bacterium]